MYHLVDNFQTKTGDALVGYYVKLKDSEGAYATLYSDTSLTPISTVSGVADTAVTDATGLYDIYVDDGSYDIEFFDKNDISVLVLRVPDVPMYSNTNVDAAEAQTLATLAASGGSALVGFIQPGAGSTARTAQAKLREAVSPEDFGATGDDTADDTAELQAMLDSGAERVTLTAGKTYKVTSALTVPANVFIEATGATIHVAHTGKGLIFTDGGGITGGKIEGPGATTYLLNSNGIDCRGTSNSPAAPTYVNGPTIVGTEISGFREYGIILQFVRNFEIDRAYVHDCVYAGIAGGSCEDGVVNAPRVYDIGPGSPADAYGMFFDRLESGLDETTDPRSYRIKIVAPDVQRITASGGNSEGIDSHGGVDISVIGGTLVDCGKGIAFIPSNIGGVQTLAPIRCKVIGTTITGDYDAPGIVVSGAFSGGSVTAYATDCLISGVNINGHGQDEATGTIGGIVLQGTEGLTLANSNLSQNSSHGVYINIGNVGLNVSGLTITDPHSDSYGAPSCIFIGGDDNQGYIGGNTFRYVDSGLATNVAVNAVRIQGSLTGLDLDFGPSTFQGIDATHLGLTLSTSGGVNLDGWMAANGTGALVAGTLAVVFAKRFPSVPKVFPSITTDLNPVRISAVSATGFTATGTGTTGFDWRATT